MKKLLAVILMMSCINLSFAQQTFTSKNDALEFVKEAFSKYFIKTTVYKKNDKKNISYNHDYEINDKRIIIIIEKAESDIKDSRYTVPYEDMSEVFSLKKNEYFKSITGIGFKPGFGDVYYVGTGKEYKRFDDNTYYAKYISFPFEMKKGDNIIPSIINAINTISRENKAVAKAAQQKSDATQQKQAEDVQLAFEQKTKGTPLPQFEVFTSDSLKINLHDYIGQNRRFKDKPTLLVTWSNVWCKPCIKIIDTLLNSGLALKYNIVLINKESANTDFSMLKKEIVNHTPDYNKDVLLLFDRNNQLEPIDENAAPCYFLLDRNLKIVRSRIGLTVKTPTISSMLSQIE